MGNYGFRSGGSTFESRCRGYLRSVTAQEDAERRDEDGGDDAEDVEEMPRLPKQPGADQA